jgi:hypothetical protein
MYTWGDHACWSACFTYGSTGHILMKFGIGGLEFVIIKGVMQKSGT